MAPKKKQTTGEPRSRAFLVAALVLLWPGAPPVRAEQFFYKHTAGDKYRVLSTVKEDVYINRRLSHRSEIINRIAVEVRAVENGRGTLCAVFQTAERAVAASGAGGGCQWGRVYDSAFDRDTQGRITIDKRYFMPVVRNVPVFPEQDLKQGDTWSEEGYEAHDFRSGFGIHEPYRIPFTAHYEFLGERSWRGVSYPAFSVSYRILSEPDPASGTIYPTRVMGASDQVVYWNPELGQAAAYAEHFRMIFELSDGATIEYRGEAEAELIETEIMDKRALAQDIMDDLAETGIEDVSVRESDEGIVLSLDNIQFYPDSNEMLPGEREKLDKSRTSSLGTKSGIFWWAGIRRWPVPPPAGRSFLCGGHRRWRSTLSISGCGRLSGLWCAATARTGPWRTTAPRKAGAGTAGWRLPYWKTSPLLCRPYRDGFPAYLRED